MECCLVPSLPRSWVEKGRRNSAGNSSGFRRQQLLMLCVVAHLFDKQIQHALTFLQAAVSYILHHFGRQYTPPGTVTRTSFDACHCTPLSINRKTASRRSLRSLIRLFLIRRSLGLYAFCARADPTQLSRWRRAEGHRGWGLPIRSPSFDRARYRPRSWNSEHLQR